MAVIASLPHRGDKVVNDDGTLTEAFAEYLSDLYESNNGDNPLNNYRGAAAPLITNNADEGYTTGSKWIFGTTVYFLTSFTGTDANWTAVN